MTGLPDNVEDLLARLEDSSRSELYLVHTLAEAIRRADEQVLREVRSVTLQHEIRREAILGELHTLATRLCCLPPRHQSSFSAATARAAIRQQTQPAPPAEMETAPNPGGGHWRQAAQNIDEELDFTFNSASPRH